MTEAEHTYTPPRHVSSRDVPAEVARYLDGADLLNKTQALRLSTVDADGWPHAALLTAGDILALPGVSGSIGATWTPAVKADSAATQRAQAALEAALA